MGSPLINLALSRRLLFSGLVSVYSFSSADVKLGKNICKSPSLVSGFFRFELSNGRQKQSSVFFGSEVFSDKK